MKPIDFLYYDTEFLKESFPSYQINTYRGTSVDGFNGTLELVSSLSGQNNEITYNFNANMITRLQSGSSLHGIIVDYVSFTPDTYEFGRFVYSLWVRRGTTTTTVFHHVIVPLRDFPDRVYLAFIKPFIPGQPAGITGWSLYRINGISSFETPVEMVKKQAEMLKSLAGLLFNAFQDVNIISFLPTVDPIVFRQIYSYNANKNYANVVSVCDCQDRHPHTTDA